MNLECSSVGDKRFSAFYANVEVNGKLDSIENHYQLAKRFGDKPAPTHWKQCKGRRPTHIELNNKLYAIEALTPFYKILWVKYLVYNPSLIEVINKYDTFSDRFKGKNTFNCQADVIAEIKEKGLKSVLNENLALLESLKLDLVYL